MKVIKNSEQLIANGAAESRRVVLEILDETLARLDSYKFLKENVKLDGSILKIGSESWDLSAKRHVYVIGAGKAANAMARAFDEILGPWLTDGIAIVKIVEDRDLDLRIKIRKGGHPLPEESGFKASLEILEMVDRVCEDDLVIGLMSGGCSSLMSCPMEGMTLEEEIETRDIMLKTGARVEDVNAVCRHVSRVNGGKLAKRIEAKGAEMICLLIQDALDHPRTQLPLRPSVFGYTPMAADATTLERAKQVIANYRLRDRLPKKVIEFYDSCTEDDETPKSLKRWTGYFIGALPDATAIAIEAARARGLNTMLLSNRLEGEAREVGVVMSSIAREIQDSGSPVQAPCVIVAAGEMGVRISPGEKCGLGGPGQEMATSFAIASKGMSGVCIASVDTEGTDGPTDLAGGITDSSTYAVAVEKGVDLHSALRDHDVRAALVELGCGIITGNTGTNLCDLHIMYVPKAD